MVFYQTMDLARFITVYIVQLGMGIVYLIFGILILKRDRKRLNQIFSFFYIMVFVGTLLNVIYVSFTVNPLVKYLHIATVYLLFYAPLYLLVVSLIILKSEKVITVKKNNIIALTYAVLLFGIFLIPGGVTIDETSNWKPVWSLPFVIYALTLVTLFVIIPFIYFSIKIYGKFEDKILKRRWLLFNLGFLPYFGLMYMTTISNYLNDPGFRLLTSLVGLSLYATAILLYTGIGRQIR